MVKEPTSIEIIGIGNVSAVLSGPDQPGDSNKTGVIIAHGAANDMNNSLIVAAADGLASAGYTTLRFNFPYKEKGKKSPDTESTLIRTWQSAVSHLLNNERFPVDRVVAAGKSMGGRIACQMVAADKMVVEALIFLGYPLHAPVEQINCGILIYTKSKNQCFFSQGRETRCAIWKNSGRSSTG
jgi:uncharacterized protein